MQNRFLLPILSLVFASITIFLGYFAQRDDFQSFIGGYAVFFGGYIWILFFQQKPFSEPQIRQLLLFGIGLRVILLFSIPNLSDDYARFLWDGHLTVAGINPFIQTPAYYIENQIALPGINPGLFAKLNSPGYFTVYPPVCQAVFALASWIFPSNELGGVFVMKLFLLICEIGTIHLLSKHFVKNKGSLNTGLIYALNPLPILEICGNCHFEGAMVFFLIAGILALEKGHLAKSSLWWALATSSKLIPIMFLPIVWRWLGWRKGLVFNAIFTLACLIIFTPVLSVLPNILDSLDLYFRQFQFNASVYYLIREIGFCKIGWDIGEFSGPVLAATAGLGVLAIALATKSNSNIPISQGFGSAESLATPMLFALFLYLSLSATVQPWYITGLLALSCLTKWRFAVLWSGLAALSYSHYEGGAAQENFRWIILEYTLLWLFFFWEVWRNFVQKPT
ncbi:MAG: hypothetical protein ACKVT2_01075 [Saprospiraceae bacterium]